MFPSLPAAQRSDGNMASLRLCTSWGTRHTHGQHLKGPNMQHSGHMGQKNSNWINGLNMFQESI